MLWDHEQNYVLSMDALVTVYSRNTSELCFGHASSGHRLLSEHERNYVFGHGCSGHGMLLEPERKMLWAWALWSLYVLRTRTVLCFGLWSPYALGTQTELRSGRVMNTAELRFGHACSGHCMLFKHDRNHALGMDALVTVCSGNTNELCFGHGCSGHRSRTWTTLRAGMRSAANTAAYAQRESKSALEPTAAYVNRPWTINVHIIYPGYHRPCLNAANGTQDPEVSQPYCLSVRNGEMDPYSNPDNHNPLVVDPISSLLIPHLQRCSCSPFLLKDPNGDDVSAKLSLMLNRGSTAGHPASATCWFEGVRGFRFRVSGLRGSAVQQLPPLLGFCA